MHTLFDFITHIKGVEYILAILFIGGYILYWEFLKPKPFHSLAESGRKDLEYLKGEGLRSTMKCVGRVAAAPFIGLAYIVALPFVFFFALGYAVLTGVSKAFGGAASFGWRPAESYFTGKKKTKRTEAPSDDSPEKKDTVRGE